MIRKGFTMIVAATKDGCVSARSGYPVIDTGQYRYMVEELTKPTSTKNNALIMGRKTWNQHIPHRRNALKHSNCDLVVLSRTMFHSNYASAIYDNFNTAIHECLHDPKIDQTFVLGGHRVFSQAMVDARLGDIYWNELIGDYPDAILPITKPTDEFFYLVSSDTIYEDAECSYDQKRFVKRTIPNI